MGVAAHQPAVFSQWLNMVRSSGQYRESGQNGLEELVKKVDAGVLLLWIAQTSGLWGGKLFPGRRSGKRRNRIRF